MRLTFDYTAPATHRWVAEAAGQTAHGDDPINALTTLVVALATRLETAAELADAIHLLDRYGVPPALVGGDESDTYPVPVVRWSAVYELIAPHLTGPRGF